MRLAVRAILFAARLSATLTVGEGNLEVDHETGDDYKVCQKSPCIRKCCPEGHISKRRECVPTGDHEFQLRVYNGTEDITNYTDVTFKVIHRDDCFDKRLALLPKVNPDEAFYVQSDGSIFKPFDKLRPRISFRDYCLETLILGETEVEAALVCYNESTLIAEKQKEYAVGEWK